MWKQRISASCIAAATLMVPAQQVQANDFAKGLATVIIACGITQACGKKRPPQGSGISSHQRQENRQVQSALNYFGYHVGTVDGSIGPRSRAAISQYQAQMGFTPDGKMEAYERDFLLTSHQRALASAHVSPYNHVVATQGPQGLLRNYRNQELGLPNQIAQPAQYPGVVPAPSDLSRQHVTPPQTIPVPVPAPVPVPPTRGALDNLQGFPVVDPVRSVSGHCNEINVLTSANGGITTAGRISDAAFALNEQFCLSRTHAMAESAEIAANLPGGMTEADVQAHCNGLKDVIAPQVEALSGTSPAQAMDSTRQVLEASGQPIDQLSVAGKVCLGVGYRIDDAKMAMASSLLLTGAGEQGYAESVSHHLREGFGATAGDVATQAAWMDIALTSAQNGNTPVLGQSVDRMAILKAATSAGSVQTTAALPVFPSTN